MKLNFFYPIMLRQTCNGLNFEQFAHIDCKTKYFVDTSALIIEILIKNPNLEINFTAHSLWLNTIKSTIINFRIRKGYVHEYLMILLGTAVYA